MSTKQDRMIKTLYELIDNDKNGVIESTELIDYLQTFSHVEVNDQNLFEVLELVELHDHNLLDHGQFNDFMTKDVKWPFDVDESIRLFQLFDGPRSGKIYWPMLQQYLVRFGIELNDADKFLNYFGSEYLTGSYLDYASYYWNNFGIEVEHTGELIKESKVESIKRIKNDEEEAFRKKREELEARVRRENEENLKKKREEDERKRLEFLEKQKRQEQERLQKQETLTKELSEKEAKRIKEEEERIKNERDERLRKQQEEEDERLRRQREEEERLRMQQGEEEQQLKKKKEESKRKREEDELRLLQEARQKRKDEEDERKRLEEAERLRKEQEEEERRLKKLREEEERKRQEDERLAAEEAENKKKTMMEELERIRKLKEEDEKRAQRDAENAKMAEERTEMMKEASKDPAKKELFELEGNSADNNIVWQGHYIDKGNKVRMIFQNFQISFSGEVFGHGNDLIGDFTIKGSADVFSTAKNPKVSFEKNYNLAHSQFYNGTLNNGKIEGTYVYGNNLANGTFEIENTGSEWEGTYFENQVELKTKFKMVVDVDFVFAIGLDDGGNFMCKGSNNSTTDEIKWAKVYFGGKTVMWVGKSERLNKQKKKSIVTVRGVRHPQGLPENTETFILKGRYGQLSAVTGKGTVTGTNARTSGAQTPKVPDTPTQKPKDLRVAIPEQTSSPKNEIRTPQIPKEYLAEQPKITKKDTFSKEQTSPTKPQIPKPPAKTKPKDPNDKNIDNLGENIKEFEILWAGKYSYEAEGNSQKEKSWDNFQIDTDGTCEGYGSDPVGEFNINGRLEFVGGKPKLFLTQEYTNIDFRMKMEGEFQETGEVKGRWVELDKSSGAEKNNKGNWSMKACSKKWSGHYMENDVKKDLAIELIVESNFVYCCSMDNNGFYMVKGNNDEQSKQIVFVKYYNAKKEEMLFEGEAKKTKPTKLKSTVEITGTYKNKATGTSGPFFLKGMYGQVNKEVGSPLKPNKRLTNKQPVYDMEESGLYLSNLESDEIPSLMASTLTKNYSKSNTVTKDFGQLEINPVTAELYDSDELDKIATINSYVEIKLGKTTCKTKVHNDCGYNPSWKDFLRFNYDGQEFMNLKVYNSDRDMGDMMLCEAKINVAEMLKMQGNGIWFDLMSGKNQVGKIMLGFSYKGEHIEVHKTMTKLISMK